MFIETCFWQAIAAILAVSILCAALAAGWFRKTQRPAVKRHPLRRWKMMAVGWPVLCAGFAAVILAGPGRNWEQRICDTFFILIALVFFFIGMNIWRRVLTECGHAVEKTTALVVSDGRRVHAGNDAFFPVMEFQANGTAFRVTARSGSSRRRLREGDSVALFYTPENPALFYVPILQQHDRRIANLLCGTGVLFPLLGLLAPLIRLACGMDA